jgi:hypothetical protein
VGHPAIGAGIEPKSLLSWKPAGSFPCTHTLSKALPLLPSLRFFRSLSSPRGADRCQPRTLVRGAGFQTRGNVPAYKLRAFSPGGSSVAQPIQIRIEQKHIHALVSQKAELPTLHRVLNQIAHRSQRQLSRTGHPLHLKQGRGGRDIRV